MKRTMLFLSFFLLGYSAMVKAQQNTDKYYVFTAWEESGFYSKHTNEPIVSNVAHNKCNEYLGVAAKTQFNDYWKAFIKTDNGVTGITVVSHDFKTYDEAESYRRKAIADFNSSYIGGGSSQKHQTIIIKDFSFTCD